MRQRLHSIPGRHKKPTFEAFFDANYSIVVAFCRRRLPRDVADDAVAETMLAAWQRFDSLRPGSERAWILAIARNKVAHQWRSVGRRSDLSDRVASATVRQVDENPDPAADAAVQAAAELSEQELELFALISWEGLTPADLAVVLDITPNAAAIRIHRLRKKISVLLDEGHNNHPTRKGAS